MSVRAVDVHSVADVWCQPDVVGGAGAVEIVKQRPVRIPGSPCGHNMILTSSRISSIVANVCIVEERVMASLVHEVG